MISAALDVLQEHFDTVVILAETLDEGESRWWRQRRGSTFASVELARQYVKTQEGAYHRDGELLIEDDDDDDGDNWKKTEA